MLARAAATATIIAVASTWMLACTTSRRSEIDGGHIDGGNACAACFGEDQCRGLPCTVEGATCTVTPHCTYTGQCECRAGRFSCTYTDCF